jgi:hypothetical protein
MSRFISLFGIMLALSPIVQAQRVLYSSQSIKQRYHGPLIKAIRPHSVFTQFITIKYADGHSEQIDKDSIWGYEDRHGRIHRYYNKQFYLVRKANDVVYYSIQRPTGQGIANLRYFSQDYDSPLRWTKAKARNDSHQIE